MTTAKNKRSPLSTEGSTYAQLVPAASNAVQRFTDEKLRKAFCETTPQRMWRHVEEELHTLTLTGSNNNSTHRHLRNGNPKTPRNNLVNSKYLQNMSVGQLGDGVVVLQKFVKSHGERAFFCRTVYQAASNSYCFLITNKVTYDDPQAQELRKFVVAADRNG